MIYLLIHVYLLKKIKIYTCILILYYKKSNLFILRLKIEKEEQRRNEEEMSLRSVEPRDPLTGETSFEALQREIEEHRHVVQVLRENEERIRKVKEMERWAHGIIYKFTMYIRCLFLLSKYYNLLL